MNPLIYLAIVCSASAGITLWQQNSINAVHQNIARVANDLVATRQEIETSRVTLTQAREQLSQIRGEQRRLRQEQLDAEAQLATLTPQQEGWWPNNRPYFYLPKKYLAQVRFAQVRLPIAQVNALMTKRVAALDPHVISVTTTPEKDGTGTFGYQLFEAGKINDDMRVLLGMTEAETFQANQIYAGFDRAVKDLQAARIQRVDPPQVQNPENPDRLIVARMPDLSAEIAPLQNAVSEELTRSLGAERAKILTALAANYFENNADNLGIAPLEYVRNGAYLEVRRSVHGFQQQSSMGSIRDPRYSHLFGPGTPCELK